MEIIDPSSIGVTKNTRVLLNSTREKILDFRKRKLNSNQKKDLRGALIEPQIRISLNIEGMKVRERHTTEVLAVGKITDEIKHIDHAQEILNISNGIKFIQETKSSFNRSFVCKLHGIVEENILPKDQAGFMRRGPNRITGANVTTPNHLKIPELFEDLSVFYELSEERDPIILAVWLHHQISRIHPFTDGNGRTARLIQDWVLLKNDYFPVHTGHIAQFDYYSFLEDADEGEYNEFVAAIADAQNDVIARAIEAVESSENTDKDMIQIARAATKKKQAAQTQEYDNWRHHMMRVIESFEVATSALNKASGITDISDLDINDTGCKFKTSNIPDFQQWTLIKKAGYSRNQAFAIFWYFDGKPFYKTVAYFGRHIINSKFDESRTWRDSVSIYFSGWDLPPKVTYPADGIKRVKDDEIWAVMPWPDDFISLREILIYKSEFHKFHSVPKVEDLPLADGSTIEISAENRFEVWMKEVGTPSDISRNYISEVYKKVGI
jgi:Fic family protein